MLLLLFSQTSTPDPGGGGTNTDLWYRLKQIAIENGLELIEHG